MRGAARALAYRSGALGLRHRLRNRQTLTVAMFHRVVAPGSPAAAHADPIYTLSDSLFAACLRFFGSHYAVVSLPQVLASRAGGAKLPPRALLLTFDDGWRDNADVALPLLRRAGWPAVLFAATDAITGGADAWWQEVLLRALREGTASAEALWSAAGPDGRIPPETPALALLLRYAALDPAARQRVLAPLHDAALAAEGRQMLRADQLAGLAQSGMAIGGHGAAHLPLAMLADPAADLARCRAALDTMLDGPAATLSFPHGRYDARTAAAARQQRFTTLFTSDACLNAAPDGRPADLLGRISVQAGAIAADDGTLDPARLATWLMHRPIRLLSA